MRKSRPASQLEASSGTTAAADSSGRKRGAGEREKRTNKRTSLNESIVVRAIISGELLNGLPFMRPLHRPQMQQQPLGAVLVQCHMIYVYNVHCLRSQAWEVAHVIACYEAIKRRVRLTCWKEAVLVAEGRSL